MIMTKAIANELPMIKLEAWFCGETRGFLDNVSKNDGVIFKMPL